MGSPRGFSDILFSRERLKPWVSVIFNIVINDIFSENFIKIHHMVQGDIKIFFMNFSNFCRLLDFLAFTRKKPNGISIFLEMWREGQTDTPWKRKTNFINKTKQSIWFLTFTLFCLWWRTQTGYTFEILNNMDNYNFWWLDAII